MKCVVIALYVRKLQILQILSLFNQYLNIGHREIYVSHKFVS